MAKLFACIITLLGITIFVSVAPSTVFATSSNLQCTPSTGTFTVGDTFTIEYVLDTRTFETFGANVVALFDTAVLEAATIQSTAITSVTNWGTPQTNTIDNTLGKITVDYGNAQPSFTGNTPVGKANFKAIATGQAQFNFQFFQPDDDTTPGVAKVWGKKDGSTLSNILSDVNNCIYVVEAPITTPSPTVPAGNTPQPTQVPLPTQLPRAGSGETTASIMGFSLLLILSGALVSVYSIVTDRRKH